VSALAGADVCFHLAAEKYNSSRATPQRIIDVNISATQRLLEAAVRAGVSKVVFTSSLYAYGSLGPQPMSERDLPVPTTVYGMSKLAGEHLLGVAARDHGLGGSVARLFFVYGPQQYADGGYKSVIVANFERLRRNEAPVVYGDGRQALDYVYVDDVVDALLLLADHAHDGLVCNVGSGRAVSVADLTRIMLTVSGRDLEPVTCPPDWTAGSVRVADTALARDALGWTATTCIEDGVRRVWESLETVGG
jgi:UDP-glucose 4-epimerase